MPEKQTQPKRSSLVFQCAMALLVMNSVASTLEVFLHRPGTFGQRYLGWRTLGGGIVMAVYAAAWPDGQGALVFVMLTCFLCLGALVGCLGWARRLAGKDGGHSYYSGEPHLLRLMPRLGEKNIKRFIEPAGTVIAGYAIAKLDQALGSYLMLAGASLFSAVNFATKVRRTRALNQRDAFFEQQIVNDEARS